MTTLQVIRSCVLVSLILCLEIQSHTLCAQEFPVLPTKEFKDAPAYKVVRVIDGDTVVLLLNGRGTTVRLIGVDTPETVHPTKPVEVYGKEASQFTHNLLIGESVYVEYEPGPSKIDKYGRTLAYLYRAPDGLFVNLEIVRQGYGHAYTQYPFRYMEVFRAYERLAQSTEKGLWELNGASVTTIKTTGLKPPARQSGSPSTSQAENTVYVTRTGRAYHRDGCRSLAKSKIAISLQEAKQRYKPCALCNPPQ